MEQFVEALFRAFIPPPTGWVVVFVIVGLSMWTGWSLLREFRRLKIERGEVLEAAKRKLSESEEVGDVCEALRQWAVYSELRNTLTARAVRAVLAMREARNPDLEAIMTMMDYSEASRLNLARSAPNWLLLTGIAGTVIGLASAVVPLAPQIQAAVGAVDPSVASKSMGEAIEAMQHAFACSLWGIVAAVSISIATRKLASQQQQTVAEIQEFVLSEMASKLLPKSEAMQLEEVQRTLQAGRQFLENITKEIERTSTMMQSAAENFNTVLVDTVQRMEQIGGNLSASAARIEQTLLEATRSVEASTNKLTESANSLKQSSEDLRHYHSDLEIAYKKLLDLYERSRDELRDTIREQIEQVKLYRQEFEKLSTRVLGGLSGISGDLRETQMKFSESTEKVIDASREVKQSMQASFDRFSGTLESILSRYEEASQHSERAFREIVGVLNALRQPTDNLSSKAAISPPPSTRSESSVPATAPSHTATGSTTDATSHWHGTRSDAESFETPRKPAQPPDRGVVRINHPTQASEKKGFWQNLISAVSKPFRGRGRE